MEMSEAEFLYWEDVVYYKEKGYSDEEAKELASKQIQN